MLVDDIIRTRFLLEVDGVSCSNSQFWKVVAAPSTDTIKETLDLLAALWWDSIKDKIPNSVTLACCDWDNQSQNEVQVSYPGLTGTGGVGDHHPALSVLTVHIEGWDDLEDPVTVVGKSRQSISGFLESISTRGRILQGTDFTALELFYTQQHLLAVGEANLLPMVRHDSAGKAWRDGGKVGPKPAPVWVYLKAQTARVSSQFRTLRGRKTTLCG